MFSFNSIYLVFDKTYLLIKNIKSKNMNVEKIEKILLCRIDVVSSIIASYL